MGFKLSFGLQVPALSEGLCLQPSGGPAPVSTLGSRVHLRVYVGVCVCVTEPVAFSSAVFLPIASKLLRSPQERQRVVGSVDVQ